MGILAVYDTTGIQDYIFNSNKLAENVGASKLVADLFAKTLPEAIEGITKQPLPDWRKQDAKGAYAALDASLPAEIVYQGGGNAFVAYQNEDSFQKTTEAFLQKAASRTRGIGVAIAAVETDFTNAYKADFERLNKRLSFVKGGFNTPVFAAGQPLVKQSARTGKPVAHYYDSEYIDEEQWLKRERYRVFKKSKNDGKSGIESFEDLIVKKGSDSFIAVVHADGNDMGRRIVEAMSGYDIWTEAVPKIRELSDKISKAYDAASKRVKERFEAAYAASEKYKSDYEKKGLPIIDLICDGDDITIVISGRFAINYAAALLREIESTADADSPFSGPKDCKLTACAGVVLFHAHYPFSEAYKLAEDCCGEAKKLSRENGGSWIDFHLHQSGGVSGLRELRNRQYIVEGKSVLNRPWSVSSENEEQCASSYSTFEKLALWANSRHSKEKYRWPRSKLKELRNAIGIGDENARRSIEQTEALGRSLPNPATTDTITKSKYAPAFDALELSDAYEQIIVDIASADGKGAVS
jgi:hypothetical protein